MEVILALTVAVLFATGVFMTLRRSLVKVVLGLALLSQGANLVIFTSAGLNRGKSPIVPEDVTALVPPYADPLPQALILTAIVISFGVIAFSLVLFQTAYQSMGTDDLDAMKSTDAEDSHA
ncbi:MAG: Na+/H+ antiporter subunit C [Candidatus Hydrogenedentes bacterium]|nr:Na+/H+ antiporter subunit C [Candidatus Hydrogenedentota bacterium]